jgi:hypothetical protein
MCTYVHTCQEQQAAQNAWMSLTAGATPPGSEAEG